MLQRLPVELAQLKAGNTSTWKQTNNIFFVSRKRNY